MPPKKRTTTARQNKKNKPVVVPQHATPPVTQPKIVITPTSPSYKRIWLLVIAGLLFCCLCAVAILIETREVVGIPKREHIETATVIDATEEGDHAVDDDITGNTAFDDEEEGDDDDNNDDDDEYGEDEDGSMVRDDDDDDDDDDYAAEDEDENEDDDDDADNNFATDADDSTMECFDNPPISDNDDDDENHTSTPYCEALKQIGGCRTHSFRFRDALKYCRGTCELCHVQMDGEQDDDDDEEQGGDNNDDDGDSIPSSNPFKCKDKVLGCKARVEAGECDYNPGWMTVMCAKSCNKCDMLDPKKRCTPENMGLPNPIPNAYKPGDLDDMFISAKELYPNVQYLSHDPWVAYFPNFISDDEITTLLKHTKDDMQRSTDQGGFSADGIQEKIVSEGRTSSNAWCLEACMSDPIVAAMTERIANLTRVPVKNFESYQVLRYLKSQKYDVHHDEGDESKDDPAGPRILTFFLYLSDVQEGGETYFPELDLKVKPVKGGAVLWPSVTNADPTSVDQRTKHAALPVIKGIKYGANSWLHLRDFETPNLHGCTGSFE